MVEIEQLEGGAFRVSRVFPNASSMQAGASALERVCAEAFMPVHGYGEREGGPERIYSSDCTFVAIEMRD